MMIKINLLPVRQVKKRELGKQVLVLYAVLLAGAVLGNGLWYSARADEQAVAQKKLKATNDEIARLEKIIGEVKDIKARDAELKKKLEVLDQLRKGRNGPVRLLDALAEATPQKVWLDKFEEKDGKVSVDGMAFSHEDVAEFMRGLQTMVWTPKGMGRLVVQKKEAKTSRVELLGSDGAIEDFNVSEVGLFFTGVELKDATQKDVKGEFSSTKQVQFKLTLAANYTL